MDLTPLLAPRSVAVVGASPRPGTYGNQTLENLVAAGFPGPVWGVHPSATKVHGIRCVPRLVDLPAAPDAVVIATPAATVEALVAEAASIGAGSAVVFAAGFAETAGGIELQRRLRAAAQLHDLPLCGPNCSGIVALHSRAPLWGDTYLPSPAGEVAVVSQSGNLAVNALSAGHGLRLHTVVSCGNSAVLEAADYLEALAITEAPRAVALYLEDPGDGAKLAVALARCAENDVGVAVLVGGRSWRGAAAVAAHTGALAGDDRVLRALVEEAGGAWASTPHGLLELAKTLARCRRTPGLGIAVVTCSGADAAVAADEAARIDVPLADFTADTLRRLDAVLPAAATAANPLDYTAQLFGSVEPVAEVVTAVGADPGVGSVLVFYDEPERMPAAMSQAWTRTREGVVAGAKRSPAPTLLAATLPELLPALSAEQLYDAGVPAVSGVTEAVECAAALLAPLGNAARLRAIGSAAAGRRAVGGWLAEHEAKALLRDAGIAVPSGRIVADLTDALQVAAQLDHIVAVKLSARDLQHKTREQAVRLAVLDPVGVREAYLGLRELTRWRHAAVLVEEMVQSGVELLVSVRRDTVVPVLVLAFGGTLTELVDDTVVVPLPVDEAAVERALLRLRVAGRIESPQPLLALALAAVELTISADLALLELNPVVVSPGRAVAVDAVARRSRD